MSAPAPWGAHAPLGVTAKALAVTRSSPARGPKRALASLARNVAMASLTGPVDAEVYGARARLYPADNLADKRALFFPQHWDAMERAALADAFKPGFTFLDVGANSGLYSLFVIANAPAGARAIAVEPQPLIKERLAFNIAASGFGEAIHHADTALAEGPGQAVLTITAKNRGASGLVREETAGGDGGAGHGQSEGALQVTVPTISLLALMDAHSIGQADAMKIDIEGAEDRVIPPFLSEAPRERLPKLIVMETLSPHWRVDCVAACETAGYAPIARNPRNVVLALAD